jgi:hypothetical protein
VQSKILSARDNEASPDADVEPHLPLPWLRYALVEGWIIEGSLRRSGRTVTMAVSVLESWKSIRANVV